MGQMGRGVGQAGRAGRMGIALLVSVLVGFAPRVAAEADKYDVFAVRFATLANFPVSSLVAGADRSRRLDIAMMIWVLKGADGRVALVDSGFHREQYFKQFTVRDYVAPPEAIAPLGVKASDVTDIFLSHMHWDHRCPTCAPRIGCDRWRASRACSCPATIRPSSRGSPASPTASCESNNVPILPPSSPSCPSGPRKRLRGLFGLQRASRAFFGGIPRGRRGMWLAKRSTTPLVTHGVLASRRTPFGPVFPDRSADVRAARRRTCQAYRVAPLAIRFAFISTSIESGRPLTKSTRVSPSGV